MDAILLPPEIHRKARLLGKPHHFPSRRNSMRSNILRISNLQSIIWRHGRVRIIGKSNKIRILAQKSAKKELIQSIANPLFDKNLRATPLESRICGPNNPRPQCKWFIIKILSLESKKERDPYSQPRPRTLPHGLPLLSDRGIVNSHHGDRRSR